MKRDMKRTKKLKIFIVDDHAMVREGLKALLEQEEIAETVYEAENGLVFLELLENFEPNIVLMDIDMPVMNGLEATEKALAKYPDLKILVLSMFSNQEYYSRFISSGVKGFILKSSGKRELEYGIRAVAEGDHYFSSELLQKIIINISNPQPQINKTSANNPELTNRELETLRWLCNGYTTSEIAKKLNLSPRTIESHRAKLLYKTDTKNTVNLVTHAIKNKIITI